MLVSTNIMAIRLKFRNNEKARKAVRQTSIIKRCPPRIKSHEILKNIQILVFLNTFLY